MKHFLLILCSALVLTSCLDNDDAQYTPQIVSSYFVCNSTDTLRYYQEADGYRLDTITVGDTVRFAVAFNAMGNNLLTARITWDSIYTDFTIGALDSINSVLLPTSDPDAGVFHLPKGYQAIVLPIEFTALKAGSPTLILTAESDSKYSPAEVKMKTPIK